MAEMKQRGFTIVELLIVIVVIAILAAIVIVTYNGVQQRARVSKANSELAMLNKAIQAARINQDKNLGQITGSYWTDGGNQALYEQTLDRIGAAAGANLSALKTGDPWGNKYGIDENEGESGTLCTVKDSLRVRPSQSGVGDVDIPFYTCPN